MQMIEDDHAKEQLEKKINSIKEPEVLEKFIVQSLQNHIAYKDLCELLLESERSELNQRFTQAIEPSAQAALINPHLRDFQILKNAPESTQNDYRILLKILPEDQVIKLKNSVVQSTTLTELQKHIALHCPAVLQSLDKHAKVKLCNLPADDQKKLLTTVMHPNGPTDGLDMHTEEAQPNKTAPHHQPTDPNVGDHSPIAADKPDVHKLIAQKVQAQQDEDELPQDKWGPKLPLDGEERAQFLISIIQFTQSDQKVLKVLFDKVYPNRINYFLDAYFTVFIEDERIELLATMIYLYKGWPPLTLKLCNCPQSVGTWEKIQLFNRTNATQRKLLTRLEHFLSRS